MVQDLDCLGLPRREREAVRYAGSLYKEKFGKDPTEDPNLFLNLSDNPKTFLSWSATSGRLPTFRTNSTRFYNFQREQWMTSRDRLSALGLPVTPSTALAMGVPTLPVQDDARASSICGNSFHFSSATVAQMVAMSCYRIKTI
ncbi:unnamed protein product [Cladocopium goreaui]|uniref:Uncharacterized protein n=1 Tax=Cladocopium goreaui TaxID=2562237 RepID=A0A9P1C8U6_9DINO|nr:unnamed protein product [Cladocopium goreaui]